MEPAVKEERKRVEPLPATKKEGSRMQNTVQENQIALASSKGLQVDFSSSSIEAFDVNNSGFEDCTNQDTTEIDEWENAESDLVDFDDSDDDLL
jgi:hypothetical protein